MDTLIAIGLFLIMSAATYLILSSVYAVTILALNMIAGKKEPEQIVTTKRLTPSERAEWAAAKYREIREEQQNGSD